MPSTGRPTAIRPAINIPELYIPSIHIPSINIPAVHRAAVHRPALQSSGVYIPELNIPALHIPAINIPALTIPAIRRGAINIPEVVISKANTSSTGVTASATPVPKPASNINTDRESPKVEDPARSKGQQSIRPSKTEAEWDAEIEQMEIWIQELEVRAGKRTHVSVPGYRESQSKLP